MDFKSENELFWKKESEMFDKTAEYYDKFRPSYPAEIVSKLISSSNLDTDSKVLEIGSGSGKATELFVPYGLNIDCVDPGQNLVTNGRIKFAKYSKVKFQVSRFEEMDLEADQYDAIISAQAFHWVPQPTGYQKSAHTLKTGGHLALIWNMYIIFDNEIDNELLALSDKHGGFASFLTADGCQQRIDTVVNEIKNSGYFDEPEVHSILWEQEYTADEYFGFVQTGNSFVQKSQEEKDKAFSDIKSLFDKHGGVIKRPYLCSLYVARKK